MRLHIVTPHGTYKDTDVDYLGISTTGGNLGILPHHIPLATGVTISEMHYEVDGKTYRFAIAGGFMYVDADNTVTVTVPLASISLRLTRQQLNIF